MMCFLCCALMEKKMLGGLMGGGLGWVWAAEGGLAGFDQAQDSFV